MARSYALARLALRLARGALSSRRPRDLRQRLAAFPTAGLPLREPVRIRWDDRQIPFVEANDDRDAAVALGLVHAHLRLAQMEIMRRIAQGRLSEVVGAVAVDLDHTLRILDFTAAVPDSLAMMPPASRAWCAGFVDGINAAIAQDGPDAPAQAEEFRLFGIRPEPWRVEDVLAVGRLAAADFSWRVWHRLFAFRDRPDWSDLWRRILEADLAPAPVPHFAGAAQDGADAMMHRFWASLGRGGSNAAAIAGHRSASGHALLSSDPHLPIMTPSNWLAVGLSSPGHRIVGLMIPGLPVVTLGRTPAIAWSGTNLHAASSDLFDVTDLPAAEVESRTERIAVRWGRPREVRVRRTAHGPVISDSPLLRGTGGRDLAMAWIGHRPSDELTAMLGIMRARDWDEFTAAADGFAAPAQNFVYADAAGRVGQCMAAHLPERPADLPADMVLPPEALSQWDRIVSTRDLPMQADPEEGFAASANDRPAGPMTVPVGFFFSPDERVGRLRTVLGGDGLVDLERLKALHEDVAMPSSPRMRDLLLAAHGAAADDGVAPLLNALRDWDGEHRADSAGALAFELLLAHLVHQLHGTADGALYRAMHQPWTLLQEDFARLPPDRVAAAVRAAARAAAPAFATHRHWGAIHRIRVAHPLAALPVIGGRYRVAEFGAGGSNETLMKTAHGFSEGPHSVTFGANARFLADMGDEDATWLVLLGGQDGWPGSSTFADQVDLWRRRDYCRIPLRPETVAAEFPHLTVLQPARVAAEQAAIDRGAPGAAATPGGGQ
ncbi:penicillin acylase family protein [Marinibaculum pumilum]|uniref:Penicillin acylase family protein n=1 Tax=Marinibaculum pumilum TaxID=1766165 RepID=A0ABV7L1W2_9PROT